MDKRKKRKEAEKYYDLSGQRFREYELDQLLELVENKNEYIGKAKSYRKTISDWCSSGRYIRNENTTYSFVDNKDGIAIEENYKYHDDDGDADERKYIYKKGREILELKGKILK